MKWLPLGVGGVATGAVIVAGEAVLNLPLLGDDWAVLFARLALPEPTTAVALQGLLKLMLLGVFSVWLSLRLKPGLATPRFAPVVAGLIVWFLVWAWVQWGMLLAGYVTSRIAAWTVAWGLIELPVAVWFGAAVHDRLTSRLEPRAVNS